jgi:hypothetical protein
MSDEIHLVMRFSDSIATVSTIEAHLEIIARYGTVWFGKMGKTLSLTNIDTLNKQARRGIPTHLYLIKRQGQHYDVHCGKVEAVSRSAPAQKWLVPPYYDKNALSRYMTLWVKLSGLLPIEEKVLSRLWLASGATVAETLGRTMAAMFVARDRSPQARP